jgi:hypothetical protein
MLGSFNHDFQGLQPQKSWLVPVTVDSWCTNDGYGAGTDIAVLLQLWLGALVCCCLNTPPALHTRVEGYKLVGNNDEGINLEP